MRPSSGRCSGRLAFGAVVATLVLSGVLPVSRAAAAPGDLDPTFSRDGKRTIGTESDVSPSDVLGVEQLADGGILVVAAAFQTTGENTEVLIARLRPDGRLDRSFSEDGKQEVDPPGIQIWSDAYIDRDGSVAVVGQQGPGSSDFGVARLTPEGVLDPSFSGDGVREIDFDAGSTDAATAVAAQADGTLVVGGYAFPDSAQEFAVARLLRHGQLDPSFSTDGKVTIAAAEESRLNDLALTASGEIVAAGEVEPLSIFRDLAVARLTNAGSLDPSFDGDGTASFDVGLDDVGGGASGVSVAVHDDGRIVIGGVSAFGPNIGPSAGSTSPLLVRLLPDGELDPSFPVLQSLPVSEVTDITVRRDGILGTGPYTGRGLGPAARFVLFRRHPDGSPDGSFPRPDGSATTGFKGGGLATELAEQSDGRVLVAGGVDFGRSVGVARYLMQPGRRDQDADGIRDRRDPCPRGFSKRRRGCPKLKDGGRVVSLNVLLDGPFVDGQLRSAYLECMGPRRALILKRRPGNDRVVRSLKSEYDSDIETGGFNARLLKPGRYYARVPRSRSPAGICQALTSEVARVRE